MDFSMKKFSKLQFLLIFFSITFAYSQNTDFTDPTFNNGSTAYFYPSNFQKKLTDMVLLSDGSMILTGSTMTQNNNYDFNAIKVKSDGAIDSSFGTKGMLFLDFNSQTDLCEAAALQGDDKILLAGTINDYEAAVVRVNSDGVIDSSFAVNGVLRFIYESWSYTGKISGIKVANDNSFYLTGERTRMLLMHFSKDGELDTSFGKNGYALAGNDLANSIGQSINLQNDGKILVVGLTSTNWQNLVVRFNTDGSVDTSYGNNGSVTSDLRVYQTSGDKFKGALQSDGKLVIAGYDYNQGSSSDDFALVRFNINGVVDSSFGNAGYSTADYSGKNDNGHTLLITADDKIFVGGKVTDPNNFPYFGIAAFSKDGTPDASFAFDGFGTAFGYSLKAMAFYNDKIVAAGYNNQNGGYAATSFKSVLSTDVHDNKINSVPEAFSLDQNYPNPFNPSTTITFNIYKAEDVTLSIYNIWGQEIETLIDKYLTPGEYSIKVDWRKRPGKNASGTYIYQLKAGTFIESRRMILLK